LRAVLTRRVVDGRRTAAAWVSRESELARPEALPSGADALARQPELVRAHADLFLLPRSGLSKVLAGGDVDRQRALDRKVGMQTGMPSGGTGLSFANGGHFWQSGCDVWHSGEALFCHVTEQRAGWILALGELSLEDLDVEPHRGVATALASAWHLCRTPREQLVGVPASALRTQLDAATVRSVPSRPGTSFLMRSYERGERDHLVAF
jgi:hypothetical protein